MAKKGGSFFDNPFGGLFDFNRDGKEDFGEQWLAFKIFEECTREDEPQHRSYDFYPSHDYSWRDYCEDGSEYGVDPEDYDTEEEYERSLKKAKYSWREHCEDGILYSVSPYDYETESEYVEALEKAKYAWRDTCEDGSEFGIDPDDYEDAGEYADALETAKYAWRATCEDGSDEGIYPEDYDTEDEYNEALIDARQAKEGLPFSCVAGSFEESTANSDEDETDLPKESDFPTKRAYDAALELATMNEFPSLYSDAESEKRRTICELILNSQALPHKYLTLESGFLIVQAAKEHFDLPCTFPDEDEGPKTWLEDLLRRVARRDVKLAISVWAWCIEVFTPHINYSPYESIIHNDVLCNITSYPKSFLPELIGYFEEHQDFAVKLFGDNPNAPCAADTVICTALKSGAVQAATTVFKAFLANCHVEAADIEALIDDCISDCCTWDELETMEAFRTHIYPLITEIEIREIRSLLSEWDNKIQEYIDDVEQNCDKYAYCRRYGWRSKYRGQNDGSVDLLDYESEPDYLEAVNEAKYAWRSWCQYDAQRLGIPLENYETEDEFQKERNRIISKRNEERLALRDEARRHRAMNRNEFKDPLAEIDKTVYGFCSVVFPSSDQPYSYLTGEIDVQVGDKVVVPVGRERKETEATVVSVGKYMRLTAPYPVDKARNIIRKVDNIPENHCK